MFKDIICNGISEFNKLHNYIIVDTDFSHPLMAKDMLDAVVCVYESRELNVASAIIRFFIWFRDRYDIIEENFDKPYYQGWLERHAAKYKNDIDKYLLLV